VRVVQFRRSSSSRCIVDQKDSISPLSTELATRRIKLSSPASGPGPKAQDVYWAAPVRTTVPAGWRCQVAILERVDDEFGADVVRDRPPDDPPGPDIGDGGAVGPCPGR